MIWENVSYIILGLFLLSIQIVRPEASHGTGIFSQHTTNSAHEADNIKLSGIASIFSPRMNFDQWKPLTGRGDPLRNDPTYDYEPPVLDRVHYWADDSRPEREKYPERKSEVLVLGVSSRKPSVALKTSPIPLRRQPKPPTFPMKYEDFSYKFNNHYPMTILVPPPPPPPGHKPSLFILSEDKFVIPTGPPIFSEHTSETTIIPELLTTYALQEANLIYQSSTVKHNWLDYNNATNLPNNTVSSDYAGWGPTTPLEDVNDSHNIISHIDSHNFEFTRQPLSYYKPILSEAPPLHLPSELPSQIAFNSVTMPSFLPTALPPTTVSQTQENFIVETTKQELTTEVPTNYVNNLETTTMKKITPTYYTTPAPSPKQNIIGMLSPMISMPMVTNPDRPEDNLYAHASDNIHIFKEPVTEDIMNLEMMQTMQPPPYVQSTPGPQIHHVNPHHLNNVLHEKLTSHTHDPYLHMRYTTPMPSNVATLQDAKATTESQPIPTYLIIQGHSKVKTYGSKPKATSDISNDIVNPKETNEVKHLHPIKEKHNKKPEKPVTNRESRSQNLKSLVDTGLGSIEIQEADIGIKYDVSDGSDVPIELYRKGIVETDENNYSSNKSKDKRHKRHTDLLNDLFSINSVKWFL